MILNPVIQGGTEEKVYKITDKTGGSFPASAKAGEFVSPNEPNAPNSIKTQSGKIVPFRSKFGDIYFIMPAEDVIVE